MTPYGYARAATLNEAVTTLAGPGATLLAGGTELLNWMRLGLAEPARVLDIAALADLQHIEPRADGGLRIGALAKLSAVAAHPRVLRDAPALAQAITLAASPQLRNLATIGGNLLQRTRCPYFRAEQRTPCNKREAGSGCPAKAGQHRHGAIFGWTDACVAVHPADPPVALAALDAELLLVGARGERRVPVAEFHRVPAIDVQRETVIEPGEIIIAIEIPAAAPLSAYVKVRERESYEYALVSAAAVLELDGSRIRRARIALGSVALKPWRLGRAEHALAGIELCSPAVAAALDAAMADAQPLPHNAYKVRMARNAALRAIELAAQRGPNHDR